MDLFGSQDIYSVGVNKLDDDHERLIDIIYRIDKAEKAGKSVQLVLEELTNHVEYHFRVEEERMKAVDYPAYCSRVTTQMSAPGAKADVVSDAPNRRL